MKEGSMAIYFLRMAALLGIFSIIQVYSSPSAYAEEKTAKEYVESGRTHLDHLEYEKAINEFTQALIINPELIEAYMLRGDTYGMFEQDEQAIRDYTQVMALDPEHSFAYLARGLVYTRLKRNKEAVDDLTRYLKLAGNTHERADRVRELIKFFGYPPPPIPPIEKAQDSLPNTAADNDILGQLNAVASQGEQASQQHLTSLKEQIEQSPGDIIERILPQLKTAQLSEEQQVMYVWAIGLTRNPKATQPLINLAQKTSSQRVQWNCHQALAAIGGDIAGQFLLDTVSTASNDDVRFELLNSLGQMQYTPALPAMYQLLELDPKEFYWQSIFAFGKMGDAAVPYLLEQIHDTNPHVRTNAIMVLGQWLIPGESIAPFIEQYWAEHDVKIRWLILSSLELLYMYTNDLNGLKDFNEDLLTKEQEPLLQRFAQETLQNIEQLKKNALAYSNAKKISPEIFQQEYAALFRTLGRHGDYEQLAAASTIHDEPALKALRERILQRNSDEALYDYRQITQILYMNRLSDF